MCDVLWVSLAAFNIWSISSCQWKWWLSWLWGCQGWASFSFPSSPQTSSLISPLCGSVCMFEYARRHFIGRYWGWMGAWRVAGEKERGLAFRVHRSRTHTKMLGCVPGLGSGFFPQWRTQAKQGFGVASILMGGVQHQSQFERAPPSTRTHTICGKFMGAIYHDTHQCVWTFAQPLPGQESANESELDWVGLIFSFVVVVDSVKISSRLNDQSPAPTRLRPVPHYDWCLAWSRPIILARREEERGGN